MKKLLSALLLSLPMMVHAGDLQDGITAFEHQRYSLAENLLLPLAQSGNADAAEYLALSLHEMNGRLEDAAQWYEQAALAGKRTSQYNLGSMYYQGHGVKQDQTKAAYWFEKAAEQGSANAQYSLGQMYEYGYGVDKDNEKSVFWYAKAAEQGHAAAIEALPISCKTAPH